MLIQNYSWNVGSSKTQWRQDPKRELRLGSGSDSRLEEPVPGDHQGAHQDSVRGQAGAGDRGELQPQSLRLQDDESRLLLREGGLRQQNGQAHQRGGRPEVPRENHREGRVEPAGRLDHLLRLLLQETAVRAPVPEKKRALQREISGWLSSQVSWPQKANFS